MQRRLFIFMLIAALFLPTILTTALAPVEAVGRNVGYYAMNTGQGEAYMPSVITANGDTPVLVTVPDAATLAGLDVLFVTNGSNSGYGVEWVANLGAIDTAIANGLVLVIADRAIDIATAGNVPGAGGITFCRFCGDDANIDIVNAGTPVTAGLTNTSLDNGSSSNHGYAVANTLPAGALNIMSDGTPSQSVTFSYPYGAGYVIYTSVPLDFYLQGNGLNPPRDDMVNIYAPNLIAYADVLASRSVGGVSYTQFGLVQISVSQAQPVYESPSGNVIRNADFSEMWLPHDFDGNGYDTYVVTDVIDVDGVPWVGIFLGSQSFGYVPLSGVTPIEGEVTS